MNIEKNKSVLTLRPVDGLFLGEATTTGLPILRNNCVPSISCRKEPMYLFLETTRAPSAVSTVRP